MIDRLYSFFTNQFQFVPKSFPNSKTMFLIFFIKNL
jgi:hypothetical protein